VKVLLCQSLTTPKEHLVFPLGLAYLASSLTNHDVVCFDPNLSPENYLNELAEKIETFKPDIIGVSLRNIDNLKEPQPTGYMNFAALIKKLKKTDPTCKLLVGGAGFSIFANKIMQLNPEVDFGVYAEGEETLPELLENLDHPNRVKGLFVRNNGGVTFTGRRAPNDFDSLPFPSRNGFDIESYAEGAAMGVQTKRGCRFRCVYCGTGHRDGFIYRMRKPKCVVDEIEAIVTKYGVTDFYFADSVFNFPAQHGREICREIIRRKLDITWEACFRPDYLSRRYMQEAVHAGCRLFDFSPDGASDGAMQVMGKDHDVDCVRKTAEWTRQIQGAKVAYEFMKSVPQCNIEHLLGLMRLVPELISQCRERLSYISFSRMRIFPNTPLHDLALKEGQISHEDDLLTPRHYKAKSHRIESIAIAAFRASIVLNYGYANLHGLLKPDKT
jgi:anaerobic magnesium-protoporphyrin IX monomethyl ester cyclase